MHTQAAQDLGAASACSEKQAQEAQVSWFVVLVSDPRAPGTQPTHPRANSNEPVTLLKAPAACLSARLLSAAAVAAGLKPGGLVLWFSPGLERPASIFFLPALNEGAESAGSRGPSVHQSTVSGQWGGAQRRKGLPQKGASRLGLL